jgi:replication factor C small subunit
MSLFPAPQFSLGFPQPLSEKYRPRRIADFIGLDKPKKILAGFAASPKNAALIFVGESGLGKTTMALALAEEMEAEVHLIPSQKCTVENVEDTIRQCWYATRKVNGFHLVLVDEADQMTEKAQLSLLSKLDSTARPPQTIFIFTCNSTNGLEKRFLSRCIAVEFSNYALRSELALFLAKVWESETGKPGTVNFERIAKDSTNNVREALNRLEVELLAA